MSSEKISLQLEKRTIVGKGLNAMRRSGVVPGTVYERGKESVSVSAPYSVLSKVFADAGKNHPVHLEIGTDKRLAMIKDVDFDPVKNTITHVAFHAVKQNEKVEAEVPVELNDNTPAERANLMIIRSIDHVEVEALPANLPEAFVLDAEKLVEVGDKITVADLIVPQGVEIMTDPETVLAVVEEPRASIEKMDAEAAETADADASAVEATEQSEEAQESAGEDS